MALDDPTDVTFKVATGDSDGTNAKTNHAFGKNETTSGLNWSILRLSEPPWQFELA